jgi:ElaB/YqjD/DUF883 family membrane-anchored ribosome-binding protein
LKQVGHLRADTAGKKQQSDRYKLAAALRESRQLVDVTALTTDDVSRSRVITTQVDAFYQEVP